MWAQELMDLKNPELANVAASQGLMSNWFSLQVSGALRTRRCGAGDAALTPGAVGAWAAGV